MAEPNPDKNPGPKVTRRDVLRGILGIGAGVLATKLPDGETISAAANALTSETPISRRDIFTLLKPKKAEASSNPGLKAQANEPILAQSATGTTPDSTQASNAEIKARAAGLSQGEIRILTEGQNFAHPAFEKLWNKDGKGPRVWGPYEEGNPPIKRTVAYSEEYDQAPGGIRLVQYFDKSRMEINNPNGDPNSEWFVTNGLLVNELITGEMQEGDARFEPRGRANVIIAGNENANGPTYATFAGLLGRVEKRVGEDIVETVTRDGVVSTNEGVRGYVKNGQYIEETGHHVASVFEDEWNTYKDGLPLTEGKWVWTTVGTKDQWVFVQAFERRTKTFTPQNPEGWKIEEGNVGRHYHQWRYGKSIEDAAESGTGGKFEVHFGDEWFIANSPKSILALRPKGTEGKNQLDQINDIVPDAAPIEFYMISQEEALAGFKGINPADYQSFDVIPFGEQNAIRMGRIYVRMESEPDPSGIIKPVGDGLSVLYFYGREPIDQLNDMHWLRGNIVSSIEASILDASKYPSVNIAQKLLFATTLDFT